MNNSSVIMVGKKTVAEARSASDDRGKISFPRSRSLRLGGRAHL